MWPNVVFERSPVVDNLHQFTDVADGAIGVELAVRVELPRLDGAQAAVARAGATKLAVRK